MKTINKSCLYCDKVFKASLREHKRGNARFCSISCGSKNRKQEKQPNCVCNFCGNKFYKKPAHFVNSKSGLRFCSRVCKDEAQKLKYGITEIHPEHYGIDSGYRAKALENYPNKCNICGYNKYVSVLEVHHKDKNRSNNKLDNLEILCPTCHTERHLGLV